MGNLTVTKPSSIVAAENPIIIGLSTQRIGNPQYSILRFDVDEEPSDGLKLKFNLTDPAPYTKSFYAKNFPNQDNYFFTATIKDRSGNTITTGITKDQIANSLAECLQKDIFISRYYQINYTGGTKVFLVAKEASERFRLNSGKVTTTNGSEISPISVATGRSEFEGGKVQDYNLYVEAYTIDNAQFGQSLSFSTFNRVTEVVLPFSADNIHRFDLSKVCKSFLSSPRPDLSLTGFTAPSYMKPFAFKYGELYPVVKNENTKRKFDRGTTGIVWALNASLPFEETNSLLSYTGTTNLEGKLINVKLLTNSPNPKKSNRDESELFYLILPKNLSEDLRLFADFQFWDGTVLENYFIQRLDSNFGGLRCINSSFQMLNFDSIESLYNKKIKFADVYIRSEQTNQLLLNPEFQTNLNSWGQVTFLPPSGSTVFGYDAGNSGRAVAYMGTFLSSIPFHDWNFYSTMESWFNDTGGALWAWDSGFGGSIKLTTAVTFPPKTLRLNSVVVPQEPFTIVIGYSGIGNANSAKYLSFLIRDSGANQLYNIGFAGIFDGLERFATIQITGSSIWTNADHFIIVANHNAGGIWTAGDQIFITYVGLSTFGNITFNRTYFMSQGNLTLNPALSYNFKHNVTFSAGTHNYFHAQFYDASLNPVGSNMLLASGGTGTYTGTTNISTALNSQIFGVKMWVTRTDSLSFQPVYLNGFSINQLSSLNNTSEVKTYQYPFNNPTNRFGVAFLNNLGTWDTFDFEGLKEETLDRTTKQITLPIIPNSDGSYPQGFKYNANYDVEITKRVIVNSGWIDQTHYNWLIELLSSNEIYSYSDANVNYLKLDSYKYTRNNQSNEYNIEATFIQTIFENNISI